MRGGDFTAHWAHVMWQCYGMRMEEFVAMEKEVQLAYIASFQLERDEPVSRRHAFINSFFKQ